MELPQLKESEQNLRNDEGNKKNLVSLNKNNDKLFFYKDKLRKILISVPYQIIITILTIYTLFADDIRVIAFQTNTADIGFDAMNITLICLFTIQIIASSLVQQKYFLNFFFVLDIISTLSLLFDISMFTDLIYSSSFSNYTFSQVAAQSKASRAAIRAIRIVKLFRIIRIVKLYKAALKAQEIKENNKKKQLIKEKLKEKYEKNIKKREEKNDMASSQNRMIQKNNENRILPEQTVKKVIKARKSKISFPHLSVEQFSHDHNNMMNEKKVFEQEQAQIMNADFIDEMEKNQSKIRKVMGDSTLKKVIIVVLLLMFVSPLFDTDVYLDPANSLDYSVESLNNMLKMNVLSLSDISTVMNKIIADYQKVDFRLIYFATPFLELPYYSDDGFADFRASDFIASSYQIDSSYIKSTRPSLTYRSNFQSQTQRTSLIAILNNRIYNVEQGWLNIGKTLFVCILLIVLLQFFNNDIETLIVHPIEKMMEKLKLMAEDPESSSKEVVQTNIQYETTVISNAIIKIGALLSIVFGSAGAEIIGKNILQEGDMNPMIEGKKKCAIFGFCDIRKFTEINQILEQDTLKFVNKISSVVHKAVFRYGGSANKNIGEAFLLVWKIPDGDYQIHNKTNEITWFNKQYLSVLADYSVFSFIKTLIKINKLPQILQYKNDYRLTEVMPGYKVEMGFGLHIGWAIEGAIGSVYKIDASYLSPNVNMASRLQAATKQFGVNFLISQNLYDVLTPGLQSYCRNIDRVTVKGSNKPLKLYTIDMNLQNISAPADKTVKYPGIQDYQPDIELKREINLQFLKEEQIGKYDADQFIRSKKEFRQVLVNAIPVEFKKGFQEGLKCYLGGKWNDAKLHFTNALKLFSNDGPTKRLLCYMKNFNFVAPDTWSNYRQLTSK